MNLQDDRHCLHKNNINVVICLGCGQIIAFIHAVDIHLFSTLYSGKTYSALSQGYSNIKGD